MKSDVDSIQCSPATARRAGLRLGICPSSLACIAVLGILAPVHAQLSSADASKLGFDPVALAKVDDSIRRAINSGDIPGAVVLIGRHGEIVHASALGNRVILPNAEPMTRDTIFDMASLTKPVATATLAMQLWEAGRLNLNNSIGVYLPEFDGQGKHAITPEQLLRHRAGLIPDNPLADYADGPELAWRRLAKLGLSDEAGKSFRYSDVGFMILGRLVESVSGEPLDQLAARQIFDPLGMNSTRFLPLDNSLARERIAPTEPADGVMLRGVVHDPRARALGGVAGHAGLFGTADDLAVYAATLLNDGRAPSGHRLLSPAAVRAMIDASDTPAGERRGLGWDVDTPYSAPRGTRFGSRSFGHTGFTGTSIWIDPQTDVFVILLTSRLHPDGKKPAPTALRREVATLVAEAIDGEPLPPPIVQPEPAVRRVTSGIDVLELSGFELLKGKRVGLVTNHTGRTRDGRSTIDALLNARDVQLITLFSPEHGIRGLIDSKVDDSKDEATGLPIYSLYGDTRKPKPESLDGLDILVYDIQDIGCRFYTYISTLGLLMDAAAEKNIPLVVLDRPNPIGGIEVDGPVREPEFASFIAHHDIPVRHGMTAGELARMFNDERKIGCELTVVPCKDWNRADFYDRTGLLWVNPSPNMRSPTEALLYPGVGLLEATNLATGRGTDTPFERVGAPWIDATTWSNALNQLGLPGTRFTPIRFTPTERQYANEECAGVFIAVTDWSTFSPMDLALGLATTLRSLYHDKWNPDGLLRFLGSRTVYEAILEGKTPSEVKRLWQADLAKFMTRRGKFLLYE
jgi:uncharacterized protein YbbC (DUF1343 family)/CubicO group peptidase (beta-lactamase class C family)